MKIICVGGGPAGLYAALLLKRADPRHDVQLYERDPEGTVRGWGVTFWDDLIVAMHEHDPESAAAIAERAARWNGLETHVEGEPAVITPEFWGHSIARSELLAVLRERALGLGVMITYGCVVDVDAVAADADLVVCADGANSQFRRDHAAELGTTVDVGRNWFAWLSTPKPFPAFRFAFARSPVGWLCCYAYAYRSDASTFVVEMPPETYERLRLGAQPAEATLASLRGLFGWQLGDAELRAQLNADGTVPWRHFPTVRNRTWHLGNVALLGDAVHTAHYSIGFGTKLALEDAMALADAVSRESDIPAVFERYQQSRGGQVDQTQRDADYSRRWFENVDRYLGLPAEDFAALLDRRRSPLVARLPPQLLVGGRRLLKRTGVSRRLRST